MFRAFYRLATGSGRYRNRTDDARCPEMREMAQDELREAKEKSEHWNSNYRFCYCQKILMTNVTLPRSPSRNRRRRSGAVRRRSFRMYSRYAEARRWRVEIMSAARVNMVVIKRSSPKLAVMVVWSSEI